MAEQIISPGVFTRENDLSFLPQGVGAIGAAIIGPTLKGPAFVPTVVRNFSEFEKRFGGLSSETYIPQTVREYLRNAGSVTVCRVLAGGGITYANGTNEAIVLAAGSEIDTVAGSKATGSLTILDALFNTADTSDLNELQIFVPTAGGNGVDGTETRFIGADPNNIPVDNGNVVFFGTGSNTANSVTSLVAAIDSANIGVDATAYTAVLGITASNAGALYNAITIQTGSGATITTTIANPDASVLMSGGVDNTDGKKIFLGAIFPSKAISKPDLGFSRINDSHVAGLGGATDAGSGNLTQNFNLKLSGSAGGTHITGTVTGISGSINPANSNYIFKKLGYNPNNSKTGANEYAGTPGYTHINFKDLQTGLLTTGSSYTGYGTFGSQSLMYVVTQSSDLLYSDGGTGKAPTEGYGWASTPYITSQFLDADKATSELFRFHTIDHGSTLSRDYKISIANLKEPSDIDNVEQYSNFSVLLRKCNDRDKSPKILE